MGLVRQVSASLVKRNIQRLTHTYLTLSLGDIAEHVGLASAPEAELYVLRCVSGRGGALRYSASWGPEAELCVSSCAWLNVCVGGGAWQ